MVDGVVARLRSTAPRWLRVRRRGGDEPPVVALCLSGGGASAGFHLGALRYLYDVVGITPTVITGTSAGSMLAAVLAQADDHDGQRRALADVERVCGMPTTASRPSCGAR